jgi:hypothetical protein
MVFPALDDLERRLLTVNWTDAPLSLVVRFNPMQVPHFSGFQFRLSIADGGHIFYSGRFHMGLPGPLEPGNWKPI